MVIARIRLKLGLGLQFDPNKLLTQALYLNAQPNPNL